MSTDAPTTSSTSTSSPTSTMMDFELDIFGQSPSLGIYTQLSLLYPTPSDLSQQQIVSALTTGLKRLAHSVPWTAGKIVCEGAGDGSTGTFKIKPHEPTPSLTVKDYTADPAVPSYADMRAAGFPMRMLDESRVASRNTIPGTSGEVFDVSPVFLLQASFVKGGLILTSIAHHQCMDAVGQAAVMELLSKACRGETFTDEEVRIANMSRENHVPLLDDNEADMPAYGKPVDHPTKTSNNDADDKSTALTTPDASTPTAPTDPNARSPCIWTSFSFSPSSQAALKSLANATKPASTAFVSTDDALTAFTWSAISRARLARHPGSTPCKSSRAVDVRPHFALPASYTGMFQNLVYHTGTLAGVAAAPLGEVAAMLRAQIDPKTSTLLRDTRAHVTALTRAKDRTSVAFATGFNLDVDIMLSSWTKVDVSGWDFGLGLGEGEGTTGPEVARRPEFAPFEGLGYLLPKGRQGEVVLVICLKEADVLAMERDEEVGKYAVRLP